MEEENTQSVNEGKETEKEPLKAKAEKEAKSEPKTGGGWGGWGFSPLSVLSDLQKAAEEISRNGKQLDDQIQCLSARRLIHFYQSVKLALSVVEENA
ncbi:hypothetical protein CJ030_MR7G011509 [Morella rubra]|uniref:Uncharacterized protein n=1 Tax=Morella rubra TaxID=262757 RepID=A0A6A1V5L8_9ROSI|nr:hypothetical protein CJ030_MR7G011509 [Morella rubra]